MRFLVAQLTCCLSAIIASGVLGCLPMNIWFDEESREMYENTIQLKQAARSLSTNISYVVAEEPGFKHISSWDVNWANQRGCLRTMAISCRPPQQQLSCIPGFMAITGRQFFRTLRKAFGTNIASAITPMTYYLPDDYVPLANYLHSQVKPEAIVFKNKFHKGMGVRVVPAQYALETARLQQRNNTPPNRRLTLAQELIKDQLIVRNRLLVIRVWVIVCGPDPVRVYLFKGGNVDYSKATTTHESEFDSSSTVTNPGAEHPKQLWQGQKVQGVDQQGELHANADEAAWDRFIVNFNRGDEQAAISLATTLRALMEHIVESRGQQAWDGMIHRLEVQVAAAVAAAIPSMRDSTNAAEVGEPWRVVPDKWGRKHRIPKGIRGDLGGFKLLGVDVLLDSALQPHILEVNDPSLAPLVKPPCGALDGGAQILSKHRRPRASASCTPPGAGVQEQGTQEIHPCDEEHIQLFHSILQLLLVRHQAGNNVELALKEEANASVGKEGQQEAASGHGVQQAHMEPANADERRLHLPPQTAPPSASQSFLQHDGSCPYARSGREFAVRVALLETAAAATHNFSVLTPLVYEALACMAYPQRMPGNTERQPCHKLAHLLGGTGATLPATEHQQKENGKFAMSAEQSNGISSVQQDTFTGGQDSSSAGAAWKRMRAIFECLRLAQKALAFVLRASELPVFTWGMFKDYGTSGFTFSESDEIFLSRVWW